MGIKKAAWLAAVNHFFVSLYEQIATLGLVCFHITIPTTDAQTRFSLPTGYTASNSMILNASAPLISTTYWYPLETLINKGIELLLNGSDLVMNMSNVESNLHGKTMYVMLAKVA